ncbi:hypothetical protein DH86_00001384 [Scytalidium sp. 3C]|nr:hypothetical protein DH86_00001384 [Scytalidium sp. 3C]
MRQPNDTTCRNKCVTVSSGADSAQQNQTISCIAACSPGKGTASDNLAGSSTSSKSAATQSANAAQAVLVEASWAGVAGIFAAVLAL